LFHKNPPFILDLSQAEKSYHICFGLSIILFWGAPGDREIFLPAMKVALWL